MSKEIKNYGRSVKTKLLTLSKESGIPYMTIVVRYFHERLLYKVAHSDSDRFVRQTAVKMISDTDELVDIALNDQRRAFSGEYENPGNPEGYPRFPGEFWVSIASLIEIIKAGK